MRILLVSPDLPITFWSLKHALAFRSQRALLPPLGLLTVAAMLPQIWEKRLIDMAAGKLRDEDIRWADYVFVSAMIVQRQSARQVIDRCRQLGAKVVAGGPLFTAAPDQFDDVDHLVLGEAEVVLPRFLRDLEDGCPERIYRADAWANLRDTPAPLWELADVSRYGVLPIQYSRGCPFDCEFCDVTVLFGHEVRTKTVDQIIAELEHLYALGWRREVFFVDDNFISNRSQLKRALLPAVIEWMDRHRYPFSFYTQASINLADDEELMRLMAEAGFECVFIGIETLSDTAFTECNKVQNKGRDLAGCIRKIQQFGMQVQGGYILGFDSDPPTIFDDLIEFIQASGVVTAMVGLLYAHRGTRLYERLDREGRLVEDIVSHNTDGILNFIPVMKSEELTVGYRRVVETLYSPDYFYARVWNFIQTWRPLHKTRLGYGWCDVQGLFMTIYHLGIRGKGRRHFWRLFTWTLRHPRDQHTVLTLAALGHHFRRVFADLPTADEIKPVAQSPGSHKGSPCRSPTNARPPKIPLSPY
ncbi:MAG: B12-binding domain-containing radical SAM protein [Sedimentisphaerales bacterium]|nr:B12-binding domain-containing radical SAM protein [Sedimentisphaerales bacterium]